MSGFVLHRSTPPRPLVVLAEDDPQQRGLYREALAGSFDLAECDDGAALLQYMRRAREGELPYPDVLVTDEVMPGVTGLEALAEVRRHDPALPALLVTSFPRASRETACRLGILALLEKPASVETLARWVGAIQAALPARGSDAEVGR